MNENTAIWWKRLLSNIIDVLIISTIIGVLYDAIGIGIAYAGAGLGIYLGGLLSVIGLLKDMDNLLNGLITVVLILMFFFIQELIFKRTIGKIILGLEIKTTDYEKPHVFVLLLRQLFKFFPFTRISLIKRYPIGLHNSILNLKVIDANNSVFKINKESVITSNLKSIINKPSSKNNLDKLNLLFDLKQKGAINEDEYKKLKDEVLNNKIIHEASQINKSNNKENTILTNTNKINYVFTGLTLFMIIGIIVYFLQANFVQREEIIEQDTTLQNLNDVPSVNIEIDNNDEIKNGPNNSIEDNSTQKEILYRDYGVLRRYLISKNKNPYIDTSISISDNIDYISKIELAKITNEILINYIESLGYDGEKKINKINDKISTGDVKAKEVKNKLLENLIRVYNAQMIIDGKPDMQIPSNLFSPLLGIPSN